ncbi:hypothetical protein GGR56DRAFT_646176 [Xylariaceae sp. FL0804]|nr:hypothetical protein GGR56DRAFT_646176 [Xylariaceae sp. FL0804]
MALQLDKYDINAVKLPIPDFLPKAVTLLMLDTLTRPLPKALIGTYNIVHVQACVTIILILNEDTTPLLSTALALWKPGEWLQWGEMRPDLFQVEAAHAGIAKAACEEVTAFIKASGDSRGLKFDFPSLLDQHLKKGRLHVQVRAAES